MEVEVKNHNEEYVKNLGETTKELVSCYLPYFENMEGEESFKKRMELVKHLHRHEFQLIADNVESWTESGAIEFNVKSFFNSLNLKINSFGISSMIVHEYLSRRRHDFLYKLYSKGNVAYEKGEYLYSLYEDGAFGKIHFSLFLNKETELFVIPMPSTKLAFLMIMEEIDVFVK